MFWCVFVSKDYFTFWATLLHNINLIIVFSVAGSITRSDMRFTFRLRSHCCVTFISNYHYRSIIISYPHLLLTKIDLKNKKDLQRFLQCYYDVIPKILLSMVLAFPLSLRRPLVFSTHVQTPCRTWTWF